MQILPGASELWITVLWVLLVQISAAPNLDEKGLYRDLFNDYESTVRPKKNAQEPVIVTINLELYQLKEINFRVTESDTAKLGLLQSSTDYMYFSLSIPGEYSEERTQVQKAVALIDTEWRDDYLTWTPSDYNNITEMIVPPSRIWLPDIGLINSADEFYEDTYYEHFRAHVYSTGEIIWSFGGMIETACNIDTTVYPFDTQICYISIENWAYNKNFVLLVNGSSGIMMDNYVENGLWTYEKSWVEHKSIRYASHTDIIYPQLNFAMQWKRKPRYYLVNLMLPCFFLLSIALLVFWLPPDAGEKVSLGVTILLAFSVFQLVIADNTPENSDCTPLLSIFVSMTMAMSTISVITTIFVLYLHNKPPVTRVPRLVKLIAFKFMARFMFMSIQLPSHTDDHAAEKDKRKSTEKKDDDMELAKKLISAPPLGNAAANSSDIRELISQVEEVRKQLVEITSRVSNQEKESGVMMEWRAVAKVLDRLMFWIVLLVFTFIVCWMLYHATK